MFYGTSDKEKKEILKLPIYEVESFLVNNKDIHIICFSMSTWVTRKKRDLVVNYKMPRAQIEVCACDLIDATSS